MTVDVSHCRSYAIDGKVVCRPLFWGLVSVCASKWFARVAASPVTGCTVKDCPWCVFGEVTVLNLLLDRLQFVLTVIRGPTVLVIQQFLRKGAQSSENIDSKGHDQDVVIEELLDELPSVHYIVFLMLLLRWSVHFPFLSALEASQGCVLLKIRGRGQGGGITSSNVESGDNLEGETVWVGVVAVEDENDVTWTFVFLAPHQACWLMHHIFI